jgi:hypothetical protein
VLYSMPDLEPCLTARDSIISRRNSRFIACDLSEALAIKYSGTCYEVFTVCYNFIYGTQHGDRQCIIAHAQCLMAQTFGRSSGMEHYVRYVFIFSWKQYSISQL